MYSEVDDVRPVHKCNANQLSSEGQPRLSCANSSLTSMRMYVSVLVSSGPRYDETCPQFPIRYALHMLGMVHCLYEYIVWVSVVLDQSDAQKIFSEYCWFDPDNFDAIEVSLEWCLQQTWRPPYLYEPRNIPAVECGDRDQIEFWSWHLTVPFHQQLSEFLWVIWMAEWSSS